MMAGLKNLLRLRPGPPPVPVCPWAGGHDGDPVCRLEIQRECGHIEDGGFVCVGHLRGMLPTGGVAANPAPCFRDDCDVVSLARVVNTMEIPAATTK